MEDRDERFEFLEVEGCEAGFEDGLQEVGGYKPLGVIHDAVCEEPEEVLDHYTMLLVKLSIPISQYPASLPSGMSSGLFPFNILNMLTHCLSRKL